MPFCSLFKNNAFYSYFQEFPVVLNLPSGGVTNDMMQNANSMIVLDDYSNNSNSGRGGGGDVSNDNDSMNEHNPFNADFRLRRNGAVSTGNNFVTPPDRIRHDPLRILMQQLQNDENGFPPDHENIYALMDASQRVEASLLLGGGGGGSGVGIIEGASLGMGGDFHFASNSTPGLGGRMGSLRPLEAQGHGPGQGDLNNAIRYARILVLIIMIATVFTTFIDIIMIINIITIIIMSLLSLSLLLLLLLSLSLLSLLLLLLSLLLSLILYHYYYHYHCYHYHYCYHYYYHYYHC